MFQVDDTIVYGNSGVCRIADIRKETFGPVTRIYYVLNPVYDERSTIYCPVETGEEPCRLRPLLTEDEVHELIRCMPKTEGEWVVDDAERKGCFTAALKSGNHAQLIRLIKTLYQQREQKSQTGKKLHLADERALHDAEHLLYEEFAHVLSIRPDEVVPYIRRELAVE